MAVLWGTTVTAVSAPKSTITALRCEYLYSPIGIDVESPRFTWEYGGKDFSRESVTVLISSDSIFAEGVTAEIKIPGNSMRANLPASYSLNASTRYYWKVIATDKRGKHIESAIATFETGKFRETDWHAKWISDGKDCTFEPAPMFRTSFNIGRNVDSARLYVSALGYYDMYINGSRVGDSHIDPGFTQYEKRSLYAVHDVTGLLRVGENTVTITLGNGFANCQSRDSWGQERAPWRDRPQFICELTADGKVVAATDASWLTATGSVVYNNIYSGDHIDARINPMQWHNATEVEPKNHNWRAQAMPPVRPTEIIRPTLLHSWGDTVYVFDMGKNIAGVCRLTVNGEAGTRVRVRHGELLKSNGRLELGNLNIYYHPLKADEGFQTDSYILSGNTDVFQPQFTYHGFRYAEVVCNRPMKIKADDISGIAMHTDLPRVGHFRCSNATLNRIYDATMLSYVNNLHSIPTDCPQREKNGWTADAHAAIDLALLNFDGITLYEKWMNDFIDNQRDNGCVAGIVPSAGWGYGDSPGPVWDAALFIVPLAIYDYYGDPTVLQRLYPTMLSYTKWLKSLEKDDGTLACGIGDWLPYRTHTPTDFTTTLYAYANYKMLARIAEVLGKDASHWQEEAEQMCRRINKKYLDTSRALYANGSQAAQAIALYWGIVPPDYEMLVAENLNKMIVDNEYALDFGLLGSKSVLRMLTKYGYTDTAIRMATRTDSPSWGYWIEKCGYTTLAETWVLHPEFRDASLDHVFMGDIAAWLTSDIVGINFDPKAPGFEHIILSPTFFEGIDWAEADYHSVRGKIEVRWERNGGKIRLTATIPPGTTASLSCPSQPDSTNPITLSPGTHIITLPDKQ